MNVDLVFKGGGVLGISYVGAYRALEDKGYRVQRCGGASVGSLFASLIIAGYTSRELAELLLNTDFNIFLKDTAIGRMGLIGKGLSTIINKGTYNSSVIEEWIEPLLKKKGISKFKDVMDGGKSRLKIIAADITKRRVLILPDDLNKYGIEPLEFPIARAVRMSCAIPLFFTPVELNTKVGSSFIVDGGLLCGFPIWIFDVEGIPRWPTFGIKVKEVGSLTSRGRRDIFAYTKDLIDAPLNQDVENFIRFKDFVRTITIENDRKIKFTDFDKVNQSKRTLYRDGYESTIKFLREWNFERYIEMNYKVIDENRNTKRMV